MKSYKDLEIYKLSYCTMSDLIAECADAANNHGEFVSCVSHLTNDWKKEGLISGKEKGGLNVFYPDLRYLFKSR